MGKKQQHQKEVQAFLQKQFSTQVWEFSLPGGSGNETYFSHSLEKACFIKLGSPIAVYHALDVIGLTPKVLAAGFLEDGTSILVQPHVVGRKPSRRDYRDRLDQFAKAINKMHHSPEIKRVLPPISSEQYSVIGQNEMIYIQTRWERVKTQVPLVAGLVDESLDYLKLQVDEF
jgi:hypothetical protein